MQDLMDAPHPGAKKKVVVDRGTSLCRDALADIATHPKLAELTPQQQKIVRLICAGTPDKQIAYDLSLAEATVKTHADALLRRLGLRDRMR